MRARLVSDSLYRVRLRWSAASGHGLAAQDGVRIELRTRPPVLVHVKRLVDLEYIPAIGVMYLQDAVGPRRDLAPAEAAELQRWLDGMAVSVRATLSP